MKVLVPIKRAVDSCLKMLVRLGGVETADVPLWLVRATTVGGSCRAPVGTRHIAVGIARRSC